MQLVNGFRYEHADFSAAALGWRIKRTSSGVRAKVVTFVLALACMLGALAIAVAMTPASVFWGMLATAPILVLVLIAVQVNGYRRNMVGGRVHWQKHYLNGSDIAFGLDEQGVWMTSRYIDRTVPFDAISAAVESPRSFSVATRATILVLPKRALPDAAQATLRDALRARAKQFVEVDGQRRPAIQV